MSTEAERNREFRKDNPYHIWIHGKNGRKFIGSFKNRKEAVSWARTVHATLGNETSNPIRRRKPVKRIKLVPYDMFNPRLPF